MYKKIIILNLVSLLLSYGIQAQIFSESSEMNKTTFGGYAQIDYNQKIDEFVAYNGKLDVHRMVLLFAHQFNSNSRFFTEVEIEHVNEIMVEQAYLDYDINQFFTFRGGLVLIPMGIINERHDPHLFNGVERTNVDKYIIPTTWREIAFGGYGNLSDLSLSYKLYITNGFNSYSGNAGTLTGEEGLRNGRQKGAESFISYPNFSGKVEYSGVESLTLGLAGYFGKTQSELMDNFRTSSHYDIAKKIEAFSSVINVNMIGLDAQYNYNDLQLKGQLIYTSLLNTYEYNAFANTNLGSELLGYYGEIAYHYALNNSRGIVVVPFVRYEHYNTHYGVTLGTSVNENFNVQEYLVGLGYKVASGAVFKADYQIREFGGDKEQENILNIGIAIGF